MLMEGLIEGNGQWRKRGLESIRTIIVTHVASPAERLGELMAHLFEFIEKEDTPFLIKACIFHYELEFIHPFSDGNGRMGRLWQQVLLMRDSLVFEYVPVEEIIRRYQKEYHGVLMECDKDANSTKFIEFSLDKILVALREMPRRTNMSMKRPERIAVGREVFEGKWFRRKEYAEVFWDIGCYCKLRFGERIELRKVGQGGG